MEEKTEMMCRYEAVVRKDSWEIDSWGYDCITDEFLDWEQKELAKYQECQSKAAAYDRLMSGGKKTLKEWANIFGMPVAVDKNFGGIVFDEIPVLLRTVEAWRAPHGYVGLIPSLLIDFNGDWKDSLTLPDGWEQKTTKGEDSR